MAAGDSARRRAQEARRQERLLREQWQAAKRSAERWEAASSGEKRVAANLLFLTERGWRLLVDRRWPGTRAANVDMLLVGPGGVFVLDVKNWRAAPTVADGRLVSDGHRRDDHIDKLMAVTRLAEKAVESLGLSPVAVRPLMVFAGQRVDAQLDRIRLLGEHEVSRALLLEPRRLGTASVRALGDHLERCFPEHEDSTVPKSDPSPDLPATAPPSRPQPPGADSDTGDGLFDLEGVRDAALNEALQAPIERWMSFLHPDQLPLVRRNWSGPARISGPAGTGKTVVALHRAAHLAQRTTGRVLYVTFANNLPRVQSRFLKAMSPAVADRVEFWSLHSWARHYLQQRGTTVTLDTGKADTALSLAWKNGGRDGPLAALDPNLHYWRDEIDYVIKGRGITTFEEYAILPRRRRQLGLRRHHREAVWELYEAYEANRRARGVHDFHDLLAMALAEVRKDAERPYTSVIVDEVQDLTLVGVRLLHALTRDDGRNALLLVGDGQQAVYPGGFRLSEAGIEVRGDRGQVLRTNYRNSKQVLDAALALVADDSFEDFDGQHTPGVRDVDLTYHDGHVHRVARPTVAAHDLAMLDALRALDAEELADAAVLCRSTQEIARYQRLLTSAGVAVCLLNHYDGQRVNAVKLGSYRKAKGLEFKRVYLPQHDAPPPGDQAGQPAENARERQDLRRTQLFVAMTRARDVLWLGSVRPEGGEEARGADS